jgi:peptide/nickel transport system ATP-binding protein
MSEVMLSVRNLSVSYYNTKVVSSVSFNIYKGETYALVGESGCGKSTIASSIMRTLPEIAQIDPDSQIVYHMGTNAIDLLKVPENEFSRRFRWKEIAMVPQGALNALNPTIRVKDHFIETAKAHDLEKDEALERAWKLLEAVKLDPQRVLNLYPIELSGGMKQRVLIALALFLNPKLVLLDEPTTALDVLTQREILILLGELKTKYSLTYMLITHDIALVADLADRVAVIYAGRIVEDSSIDNIFYEPKHPYTIGLLRAVPKLGEFKEPEVIPGSTPDYRRLPPGCKFNPRCPFAMDVCRKEEPPLVEIDKGHFVACWLYMKR